MKFNHPQRDCRCPGHEAQRARHRTWVAAHPATRSDYQQRHRDSHVGCYCHRDNCPRNLIETAIARGLRASAVMARTGCDYPTYRAVLDRMSVAA